MASGDTLLVFTPAGATFPTSNAPTFDVIATGLHLVLDFDDGTDETAYWCGVLPRHYDSSGVTVYIWYTTHGTTSANCAWEAAFERHQDGTTDLDVDNFAAVQASGTVTSPSSIGIVDVASIAFTDGSQMDSVAAGESFRLKVLRDTGTGGVTGDLELVRVEIKET